MSLSWDDSLDSDSGRSGTGEDPRRLREGPTVGERPEAEAISPRPARPYWVIFVFSNVVVEQEKKKSRFNSILWRAPTQAQRLIDRTCWKLGDVLLA